MRRLCDSNTYVTMITLCGPWHQLPRALHLMADMQAQQMECGPQVLALALSERITLQSTFLAQALLYICFLHKWLWLLRLANVPAGQNVE